MPTSREFDHNLIKYSTESLINHLIRGTAHRDCTQRVKDCADYESAFLLVEKLLKPLSLAEPNADFDKLALKGFKNAIKELNGSRSDGMSLRKSRCGHRSSCHTNRVKSEPASEKVVQLVLYFGYKECELISKNRGNNNLLNRYIYKFGSYLPDSGYFTASDKIRECIAFQSNSASLPNKMGNDLRKMVAIYFHRKTFIKFNKTMEVNHGIRLNTYDDGRSFASITMLADPNLPDTFDNEIVYYYPS